jgi:hypothetical protein
MGRLLQRVAEDKLRRALIKMPKAAIMPQSAPPLGPSGRWKCAPMAKPMTVDATKAKTPYADRSYKLGGPFHD